MADYEINKNPEFKNTVRKLEPTDKAHADIFNSLYQTLFDNDNFLKKLNEKSETGLEEAVKDIKDLKAPAFDDSGKVEGIANYNAFMNTLQSRMSIFDFLRNLKAGLKFVLHTGQIVNNGLTTEAGFALDARYGKTLQDQINKANSNLNNKAPTLHASTGTTYGIGNTSNFGHVKLSDSYTANQGAASNGIGASSKAVCDLYSILKYTKGVSFSPDTYFSSMSIYAYMQNGGKSFYLDGLTKVNLSSNTVYYLGTLTSAYRPVTIKMIPVYVNSARYTLAGYVKIVPAGNVDLELTLAVASGKYLLAGACYE